MGYALRRSRLLVWSWQLCRGMSGNFRVEPVAILPWNQWQFLHGISGNFQMESVATFAWNTHTPTAAVVFALFAPVMLVQFVVDNRTSLQGHGVQDHHLIICEAVDIDPAWYQGVATGPNALPRTTPP